MPPEAITKLILAIFRANSRLIMAGDRLTAPLGLTSARWQVLGSIAEAASSRPVAELARDLGVARQGVQRIVTELIAEGILVYEPNPRHKRAQLVLFTKEGRVLYGRALAVQKPWAEGLAEGLTEMQITSAMSALNSLSRRLEEDLAVAKASGGE